MFEFFCNENNRLQDFWAARLRKDQTYHYKVYKTRDEAREQAKYWRRSYGNMRHIEVCTMRVRLELERYR